MMMGCFEIPGVVGRACMFAFGLGFGGTALAGPTPTAVKLSWASHDAATTIAVTWLTESNVPTTIEYGINSVQEHSLTGNPPVEVAGIGWHHEIDLVGLLPNTRYRYRVGSAGAFAAESTFTTAPIDQCEPFVFVALGDARSQDGRGPSRNWASIQAEAEAAGARFILNNGDLVKEGSDAGQWATWLAESDPVNARVPMLPSIGNHDDGPGDGESAHYNKLFALPKNTITGTEDYYYVIYNNLLIFSLSTQTFDDFQAQANWMKAIAGGHPEKWKVAFFHHPVFTTQTTLLVDIGHPPNEKGQNRAYGPAFDEAKIDVVIQSHNHIYERFRPLVYDASAVTTGREVSTYGNGVGQGRLYIVSGGAGALLDPLIESRLVDFAPGSESRSKDHHFMKFSIAGKRLEMTTIRTTAGNSSGGGSAIDQVVITRPGTDPCATSSDPDVDGDHHPRSRDCNDGNPSIHPGAVDVCGNSIDEDCSGQDAICPPPPPPPHDAGNNPGVDASLDAQTSVFPDAARPTSDAGGVVPDANATQTQSDAGVTESPSPLSNAGGCACAAMRGANGQQRYTWSRFGWIMLGLLGVYSSRAIASRACAEKRQKRPVRKFERASSS